MKKQQIKQLATSIAQSNDITKNVFDWIINNLSRSEMKLLMNYLVACIKDNTVVVKYAGQATESIKEKIKKMFPNKNIVYTRSDEEIGAGIKLEFGDFILDYTVSNMIVKIMKSIRESL